jgi:hypothetical protein
MAESLDSKLARVAARLQREKDDCPVCEARNERAAIMEMDAKMARDEADRLASLLHPCRHTKTP